MSCLLSLGIPHILVVVVLLSGILILVRRNLVRKRVAMAQRGEEEYQDEKKFISSEYEYQEPLLRSTMPSSSPTLFETNLTNVRNLESVPASPVSPISTSFESFEPPSLQVDIPRRRSYTKTITGDRTGTEVEVEVTGEIVVSPEGWRRHTRVFGGGVCKACEESERRMSA